MKQICRCMRILILSLLAVSVFVPIFLLSDTDRLKNLTTDASIEFIEDKSSIKFKTDAIKLNSIKEEQGESLKEPALPVYKYGDISSVSYSSSHENVQSEDSGNANGSTNMSGQNGTNQDPVKDNPKNQPGLLLPSYGKKQEQSKETEDQHEKNVQSQSRRIIDEREQPKETKDRHEQNVRSQSWRIIDEKVKQMRDQLIRAKAYLNFAPPNSNSQLVRELKLRIKEVERALGESNKDSDLSKSALQRMESMEASLLKASRVYSDCSSMAMKLRASTYNAEEQVQAQKNQAAFLVQLAGRTTPRGLHCLSMRLTAEYFSLQPEERELPNQHKLLDPDLYHFALFSDNVLACSVVVNSTISSTLEREKIVFHVVTDSLNLPAISMWFLLNPPGKAAIQVQSIDTFESFSSKYSELLQKQNSRDPRYMSVLNHLRFYLPDIFPLLNKILFLDHDVVVKRDLTGLWNVNMKGKVNGAVETCQKGKPSFRQMNMFINFSDPMVAKRFDINACTWAFGMNMFDLQEWRRQNLTGLYHKYLHLGNRRPLWKAGSLPLGWVTFYNHTLALDPRWHVLGLGRVTSVNQGDIDRAAVVHYDGTMKPWLDIGIEKYRDYWRKHVNYDHPYLQQCNIHK